MLKIINETILKIISGEIQTDKQTTEAACRHYGLSKPMNDFVPKQKSTSENRLSDADVEAGYLAWRDKGRSKG